jgi:peptidylprolyl isomerase
VAYSTYTEKKPEAVKVDDADTLKAIYAAIVDHTVGSRVQVMAPPEDAFGEAGNPSFGVDPADNLVFLVDIMGKVLAEPAGATQKPPASAPKPELKDGVPTGFDFSKAPKTPSDKLQVITLIKGTGTKVAKGDTTIMDYLGSVYGSKEVFDESYSKDPFTTAIGTGSVIKGWDQGLVGVPVGSRVVLVIPPDLAYRDQKKEGIPANSTLTFVVDVLATY